MKVVIFAVPYTLIGIEIQKEIELKEIEKNGWLYGNLITDIETLFKRAQDFHILILLTPANFGNTAHIIHTNFKILIKCNPNLRYHSIFDPILYHGALMTIHQVWEDNSTSFEFNTMMSVDLLYIKRYNTCLNLLQGERDVSKMHILEFTKIKTYKTYDELMELRQVDLQEILKSRGVSKSGNKDTLVKRILNLNTTFEELGELCVKSLKMVMECRSISYNKNDSKNTLIGKILNYKPATKKYR